MRNICRSTFIALAVLLGSAKITTSSFSATVDYSDPLEHETGSAFHADPKLDSLGKGSPHLPYPYYRSQTFNEAIEREKIIKSQQSRSPSAEVDLNRMRPDPWDQ